MFHSAFAPYGDLLIEYLQNYRKSNMLIQHYHDTYEIYLQMAGTRTLILNDICYTLQPGDLYIIRPFELHYTQSRESPFYERYLMSIPPHILGSILTQAQASLLLGNLDSCVIHLDPGQKERILEHFRRADEYQKRNGFLAEKLVCCAVVEFLVCLNDLLKVPSLKEELTGQDIPAEIVEVIHYINHNYHKNISLEDAAALVHLSKSHFCRLFHSSTGATFLEYLHNVRLARVHQLLLATTLPLSEVAARCGFSSTAHLSHVFRSAYGVSPREFRRLNKTGDEM